MGLLEYLSDLVTRMQRLINKASVLKQKMNNDIGGIVSLLRYNRAKGVAIHADPNALAMNDAGAGATTEPATGDRRLLTQGPKKPSGHVQVSKIQF